MVNTLYRWRWPLSLLVLLLVGGAVGRGGSWLADFDQRVDRLGPDDDPVERPGPPRFFDARFDIWFDANHRTYQAYREIEDRFGAEDAIWIALEETEHPLGAFAPEALDAIARLSAELERVPGVLEVKSLVRLPWSRTAAVGSGGPDELIITDLFPTLTHPDGTAGLAPLSEDEIVRRMVAALGGEWAAEILGPSRVRRLMPPGRDLADLPPQPGVSSLISRDGRTCGITARVLRRRPDSATVERLFPEVEAGEVAAKLYTTEAQWAALRGVEHFRRVEMGLAVPAPDLDRLQAWAARLEEEPARRRLERQLADPTRNFVVGPDGAILRKYYEYDPLPDGRYVDRTDPQRPVEAPAGFQPHPRSSYDLPYGGFPRSDRAWVAVAARDGELIAAMYGLVAILLLIICRRLIPAALPLVVVATASLGMVGLAFASGRLFNNLSIVAPTIVVAVGIADGVHLITHYLRGRRRATDRRALILDTLRANLSPVLLTSATTAIGFFSLLSSGFYPVRSLGLMAGIGTLLACAASLTVLPAVLSLLPLKRREPGGPEPAPSQAPEATEGADWAERLADGLYRRRRVLGGLAVVLIGTAVAGLVRLGVDADIVRFIPEDHPSVQDLYWLEARIPGRGALELLFQAPPETEVPWDAAREARLVELRIRALAAEQGVSGHQALSGAEAEELASLENLEVAVRRRRIAQHPIFLERLARLEARLMEEAGRPGSPLAIVHDVQSPVSILKELHRVQNGGGAAFHRLPVAADIPEAARTPRLVYDELLNLWSYQPAQDVSTLVAQYYLQYDSGVRPQAGLSTHITSDRSSFRVNAWMEYSRETTSADHLAAAHRIREIVAAEFPELDGGGDGPLARLAITGKMFMYDTISTDSVTDAVRSLSLALALITLIIVLVFRSLLLGAISMVPNVLPIVLPLGAMGLMGWHLDGPSIVVATMALGVCVDDTIHFLTRFARARRRGLGARDAVARALRNVGGALTTTTIVLALGFAVLAFSGFRSNAMMGKLGVAMIVLAWVADLIFTPALIFLLPDRWFGRSPDRPEEASA